MTSQQHEAPRLGRITLEGGPRGARRLDLIIITAAGPKRHVARLDWRKCKRLLAGRGALATPHGRFAYLGPGGER